MYYKDRSSSICGCSKKLLFSVKVMFGEGEKKEEEKKGKRRRLF
jgi:hypothetical protein